jgi:DNA-binding NtrC family response regulator
LQERTFERVGSSDPVQVDVRILAATHQDLEKLIREGKFREDLYYRLNVFPIQAPPLRQRIEDIPELVAHFLRVCAQRCKKHIESVDDEALALLKSYSWPGNIRQLENTLERAVVVCDGPVITVAELPEDIVAATHTAADQPWARPRRADRNGQAVNGHALAAPTGNPPMGSLPTGSLRGEHERLERDQLVRALAAAGGNKAEAARALGLARSTLVSKLKKLGLG